MMSKHWLILSLMVEGDIQMRAMKAKRDDERECKQVLPRPDIGRQNLKDVILFESFRDKDYKNIFGLLCHLPL